MPNIYVCFVWHMHQPFYKDLVTGEYHLPWTRMHALKDYYGMVQVLEEFPEIHQTFNLVPSMLVQIEEYARNQAADPFLRLALKSAEDLNEDEQSFILRYFFQAHRTRMIGRYPRYQELLNAWETADRNPKRAQSYFSPAALRDLQVLSQVAWFDEEFHDKDPEVQSLVAKGRNFNRSDQELMGRKQLEITRAVIPAYRRFAEDGQIEISTTPFYHPILPLLCDSQIASISHPYVPLPTPFRYPGDARIQLERAREYMAQNLGGAPAGLWPSEGSVSDEVFSIASELGFQWAATDNGVLARTLNRGADSPTTYRPYLWQQGGRELRVIFRDHELSDLIGFVYSRMDPHDAAAHFIGRIRENCAGIIASGRDALVPVILDGENAWEHFELSGRPFLKELYRRITGDPGMHALTVSEALERVQPEPIGHIFPGSWIGANFDVWIGAEEDNRAWELLLRARETYERAVNTDHAHRLTDAQKALAWEELLIAEGSDWCWWYGPEHFSDNREEFDHLYRSHLANVYKALDLPPPEELGRPILRVAVSAIQEAPSAPLHPKIDGEITSYFEWMGAGTYRVDGRNGAMHGQRWMVRELLYGGDRQRLYFRLDFTQPAPGIRLSVEMGNARWTVELEERTARVVEGPPGAEAAYGKIFEMSVPLSAIGTRPGDPVRFRMTVWQGALPLDALPQAGWIDLSTAELAGYSS